MIRSSIAISAALSLLLTVACETASDDQAKAEKAVATATDKITSATVEANQKAANAQAEANQKIAEAQASFMKLREDYRHSVALDLADVDQKIAKLTAKEVRLSGQAKADLDGRLSEIRASRDAFGREFDALGAASAITWDDAKTRIDKDMSALKGLVEGS